MLIECIIYLYIVFFNCCVKLYDIIYFFIFFFRFYNYNFLIYEIGFICKFFFGRMDIICLVFIVFFEFVKVMVLLNKIVSIKVCFGLKCFIDVRVYFSFCGMKWVVIFF